MTPQTVRHHWLSKTSLYPYLDRHLPTPKDAFPVMVLTGH